MTTNNLGEKAHGGIVWSAFERCGEKACAFALQLVLARLLLPEQFGLIAMVAVFITIGNVLIDAGFSRALIQKKSLSDLDVSSVFYFNFFISILLMFLLWASAPYIADFYESEGLVPIIRALSFGLVFSGLGAVHQAKLSREMKFKKLFFVSLPATVISGLIGIALALSGYGVWALVTQALLIKIITSMLLWMQTGWRPLLQFDFQCIREMFPYGSRLAAAGFLETIFSNMYVLVIGKLFALVEVGLFQRARSFQQLPVQNIRSVVGRVAFPLFSSIQDDPDRMKRGMHKAILLMGLFVFPGMALLSAISEPMIILLIGEKWLGVVPYLQWLCVVGLFYPLNAMNTNVIAAIGRADIFLRLEIIKKAFILVSILITCQWGVQTMIYGMIVTAFIAFVLNAHYTKKFIGYGFGQQLSDVSRLVCVAVLVWGVATLVVSELPNSEVLALLGAVSSACVVMLICLRWIASPIKIELIHVIQKAPFSSLLVRVLL